MKKVVYIDMDDVLCDYSRAYNEAIEKTPEIGFPQSQFGFFRNLNPIEGAIEAVTKLLADERFDVYILTAPSKENPMSYTEKRLWVEDHLGMEMVEKLIITSNKGLNKGDYLIDDYNSGKGQETFEGVLIHYGSADFETWEQVLEYLLPNG